MSRVFVDSVDTGIDSFIQNSKGYWSKVGRVINFLKGLNQR